MTQIEGEELVVFLEYDRNNMSIESRRELEYFDSSNDLYLKIENNNSYYSCFRCYCMTPFIHSVIEKDNIYSQVNTPFRNPGVLEIHCNEWIENVLCENTSEKGWKAVELDYRFLENWGNLKIGSYEFSVTNSAKIVITVGLNETYNAFPPQESKEKVVSILLSSNQSESIEYFIKLAHNFLLFIRFATGIIIPAGKPTFYQENDNLYEQPKCLFHFHSILTSEQQDYPSFNEIDKISIPLSVIKQYPQCLEKWNRCCETHRSSLSLLIRCYTKEYHLEQRVIFLVQVFDGLQSAYAKNNLVEAESFCAWKEKVLQNAVEFATQLGIEDLRAGTRLVGMLTNLNVNPLKTRLSIFIDTHFKDDPRIKSLGGNKQVLSILMDLRHGSSHGNFTLPDQIDGQYLLLLLEFMKDVDRKLVTQYILEIF